MPQLDIFILSSLVIFTSLLLLSLVFFMHTYILPKIAVSLKTRNFLTIIGEKFKNIERKEIAQIKKALLTSNQMLLNAIKQRLKRTHEK